MPQPRPSCLECKHYIFGRECEAFKRIPESIWLGEDDHEKNVEGDNGIKFEQFEDE